MIYTPPLSLDPISYNSLPCSFNASHNLPSWLYQVIYKITYKPKGLEYRS